MQKNNIPLSTFKKWLSWYKKEYGSKKFFGSTQKVVRQNRVFTKSQRLAYVEYYLKYSDEISASQFARIHNISKSTFVSWIPWGLIILNEQAPAIEIETNGMIKASESIIEPLSEVFHNPQISDKNSLNNIDNARKELMQGDFAIENNDLKPSDIMTDNYWLLRLFYDKLVVIIEKRSTNHARVSISLRFRLDDR